MEPGVGALLLRPRQRQPRCVFTIQCRLVLTRVHTAPRRQRAWMDTRPACPQEEFVCALAHMRNPSALLFPAAQFPPRFQGSGGEAGAKNPEYFCGTWALPRETLVSDQSWPTKNLMARPKMEHRGAPPPNLFSLIRARAAGFSLSRRPGDSHGASGCFQGLSLDPRASTSSPRQCRDPKVEPGR